MYISPVYLGDIQENGITLPNGPATSLNTVSAEDKRKISWGGVGKASYGMLSGQAPQRSARLLGRSKSLSSPLRRVARDLESSSSFLEREGATIIISHTS